MLVRNSYTHDTRVEKEARALSGAGYRVTIVADSAPTLPRRELRDGTTVIRVPRSSVNVPGLRYVLHEARLVRVLRGLRPDILHAHDSNALAAVAVVATRLAIPFVYDAHELWLGRPRRERSRFYFALNQATYRLLERAFVPRASAVITVSPPIARHLERVYRLPRVHLVPNYPDAPLEPLTGDLRALPDGNELGSQPIVLYLGALMAERGLEGLVDAVAMFEDAQLVLLGGGTLDATLRRRAEQSAVADRVHLLPAVPSGEVTNYAASAQVGVSPIVPSCLNYRYSLPNKLFQYMAAGIPVVASDFPQVREVVEGSRGGLVVDTTRPAEIASAVNRILADPAEARRMGARGRAAVEDRYNWSTAAETLLAVYDRLRA